MYSKKLILATVISLLSVLESSTQDCNLTFQGYVYDEASQLPLSYVNIFVSETYKGTITNDVGYFSLDSLCAGEYHIQFSHIGCESIKLHLNITQDTTLNLKLSHTLHSPGTIIVKGHRNNLGIQPNSSVNRKAIEDLANKNLSDLLENETGVHLLKNGSGISKPIVQGLYGNRLIILNNGVAQSGQQWGNDHSPEIDPFTADKIRVLKGTSAIEYGSGNLGSIVLIEPKRIPNEPHLHGQVNYIFETNGRGHTLNTRLEKFSPSFAWRINGTVKKYGDRKSSNYFLNNTGIEEGNLSVQLEKSWNDNFFLDFYGSTFNTQIGILRGSHIGNTTDLEEALTRKEPFYTEPSFSYEIGAPSQTVSHHLAKIKSRYFYDENKIFELVVSGQVNNRKEFDVRRGGRTTIPGLSLLQYNFNVDLKHTTTLSNNWQLKIGNQNGLTDNTNNPETGILPLIPDYISWKSGIFSTLSKKRNSVQFNIGLRYDFEIQKVVAISNDISKEIVRYENDFHNISGMIAVEYNLSKSQSISFNTGYAMRNPAINELYSNGLHQGVSGIEEGDSGLEIEKAFKNTLEYKWIPNTNFTLNALIYSQHFKDYIFLNPQDEFRPTIRGAFPVFKYEQTNANIYGVDLSSQFTIGNYLFGLVKYSYLRGRDVQNDEPLVFMPPNSLFGSLTYQLGSALKIYQNFRVEETEIEVSNRLVFEQKNILTHQDFVDPPSTYNLIGLKLSTNAIFPKYKIRFFAKADNLFNIVYRDYLNRQRYFSDDLGISVAAGISLKF